MKLLVKARLMALVFAPVLALGVAVAAAPLSYAQEPAFNKGISEGSGAAKGTDQATCLFGGEPACAEGATPIFKTVTNVLLFIIGAVSVIMLIIGGIRYATSNGDSNSASGAKNTILYSVIGLVIAIFAYAIVDFVVKQIT